MLAAPATGDSIDPQKLPAIASEARQAIVVINWFYADHHVCPQPSRPADVTTMQSELGDGFSVELRGQFVEIRGISMPGASWFYYASPQYPDRCTLWRKLGWDPALIWRRHPEGGHWALDLGDGSPERSLRLKP